METKNNPKSVLELGVHLMPFVYVLLLEGDRRYVGVSLQVHSRICTHFAGLGSQVTKMWKPIEIESVKSAVCTKKKKPCYV